MSTVKIKYKHTEYDVTFCDSTGSLDSIVLCSTGDDVTNDFDSTEQQWIDKTYNPVVL